MQEIYFQEIFEYPIQEFKTHLEKESNERIIFSGKYGIGKTKFLGHFFDKENQVSLFDSEKYEVYRLFPTNYSIASNEDIIRYIKYDIIIEMLKKSVSIDEIKLSLSDTLPYYAVENIDKVTAALVYMIPKLGKEVIDCFEKIDKLKEDYLSYHETINKSSGDNLVDYLQRIEVREGSIYEGDITTKIISETIKKNGKDSILLIDDVDRLDPEHVFRILNVFASHFDSNTILGKKNKFNFDKIIIVCDFNNIRNIFHHRYGIDADFMGYIDKFYSSDVYHFDNRNAIIGIVSKILESLKFELKDGDSKDIISQLYLQNKFILNIISLLILRGFISLRNIIKVYKKNVSHHYQSLSFDKSNRDIYSWRIPITMQLRLLKDFFGDYQNMKKTFEHSSLTKESLTYQEEILGSLLYNLSFMIHNFNSSNDFLFTYNEVPIVIEAKLEFRSDMLEWVNLFEWNNKWKNDTTIPERGNRLKVSTQMFWNALNDVTSQLHREGFLR